MLHQEELSDPEDIQKIQPLITQRDERRLSQAIKSSFNIRFRNFDENEEATKIQQIIGLRTSYFKCCVIVPVLAICTGLFFLLFLYWYPYLRKIFFYNECGMEEADFLFIVGNRKCLLNGLNNH